MMMTFFISLLVIIILTYYYYQYLHDHFWFNLGKNLGQPKFYSGKLHPNIYFKKDLTDKDKNGLVQLYANYMKGVVIDKKKIDNFLTEMPHSEIFYMKVNSIYYGAVMNSIIEIKYKKKKYLSNFVDYAIINKQYRDKGIFKELMNYIATYSNKMNAKYVIFKIDRKPIPSFYEYNITSNYYYCCSSPFFKGANPNESLVIRYPQSIIKNSKIISHYFQTARYHLQKATANPCSENEDQFFKYKNSKDIIILSCPFENKEEIKADNWDNKVNNLGVCPFFKGAGGSPFFKGADTIMTFKRNSPESIELLHIDNPNKENIQNIIEYLYNNYSFKILMVDDIGNNHHLIKVYPESFKVAYPVYHYILGLKDKIAKENLFYYF
jgi:hypothetical protein